MPLRAIIDGKTVLAPDLSGEEWKDLKLRHKKGLAITMGCCGAPGHLRISPKGTQHFYHATATGCDYEHESKEHLEIKYLIYRTCKSENWETTVEYPAPDRTWISDVCAVKDGRKVVFEVQISTIPMDVLNDRDTKYRDEGIESYWLLEKFLGKTKDFRSWYDDDMYGGEGRPEKTIPFIDFSVFDTGPENHLFIAQGIRSVGLDAKKQTISTTHQPAMSIEDWVRHVLAGEYKKYLDQNAAAFRGKIQLIQMAAPALRKFHEFSLDLGHRETYKKKAGHYYRIFKADTTLVQPAAFRELLDAAYAELDQINREYRTFAGEDYGLFVRKKMPRKREDGIFFRPESEAKNRRLRECVEQLSRRAGSFNTILSSLEREITLPGHNR